MSPSDAELLRRLLRCQLTAVNQQFVHILALRVWGQSDVAAAISKVDLIDTHVSMRILDHLAAHAMPLDLAGDRFTPGGDLRAMLRAEQAIEQRLAAILLADAGDPAVAALLAEARAPRAAYGTWLERALAQAAPASAAATAQSEAEADAFAGLIALIEQTMIHAFLHWHGDRPREADWAWASSGGVMMQATALVQAHAARHSVPVPAASPAPRLSNDPDEARALDNTLAAGCADRALGAAGQARDAAIAGVWHSAAALCRRLAEAPAGEPHPAPPRSSGAFQSFGHTLEARVRSKGPPAYD